MTQIFISYARKDHFFVDRLRVMEHPLAREAVAEWDAEHSDDPAE